MHRWKPIRTSRDGPLLSNLFFADNIILFAEASVEQAMVIQDCLRRFVKRQGRKLAFPNPASISQRICKTWKSLTSAIR